MNRRRFLKFLGIAPVAAGVASVVGLPALRAHEHDFQPDPRFFGYSCECGAERSARVISSPYSHVESFPVPPGQVTYTTATYTNLVPWTYITYGAVDGVNKQSG